MSTAPTTGMNDPRNTATAIGMTRGNPPKTRPSTQAPRPMPTASTKATKICTRTKLVRVPPPGAAPRRRPRSWPGAERAAPPSARCGSPSIRMKSVANRVSATPARKRPADDPDRQGPGQERLAVPLDGRARLVQVPVDVALGEVQRRIEQEPLEFVEGDDALALQVGESAANLEDDEHDEARDDREQADLRERDREPLGPAVALQELHEGHEEGRQEDRDHEREPRSRATARSGSRTVPRTAAMTRMRQDQAVCDPHPGRNGVVDLRPCGGIAQRPAGFGTLASLCPIPPAQSMRDRHARTRSYACSWNPWAPSPESPGTMCHVGRAR